MKRNVFKLLRVISFILVSGLGPASSVSSEDTASKPNFVLFVFEDMSPRIGAFGDTVAHTPVLDAFAETATLYPNTFTAAGVCAPSRAALITGVYQQQLGAQHMRAKGSHGFIGGGPIEYEAVPPAHIKAFPELLRRAGYYTTNNGKTDYQFGQPFTIWDDNSAQASWRNRREGQPFFTMINLTKTHESYIWPEESNSKNPVVQFVAKRNREQLAGKVDHVKPGDVSVPPYLPDTPVVRADIARHYNNIAFQEQEIDRVLNALKEDGLLQNTIIIITTDHGDGLPRMKRTLYDSGIKVPLLVRMPGQQPGTITSHRMVSFVDISATVLSLAGVEAPEYIKGVPFIGTDTEKREYVFASEDRHDDLKDRHRAVRDKRFKYIRNFMPENPLLRHIGFRDFQPTMQEIWRLYKEDKLTALQASYLEASQSHEELYDTDNDPHETLNLINRPEYNNDLNRLRTVMDTWLNALGPREGQDETEMIQGMWPGMMQPKTSTPTASVIAAKNNLVSVGFSTKTEHASIGYRYENDPAGAWRLYSAPFSAEQGTVLYVKAIRYGYKESDTIEFTASPLQ